MSSKPSLIITMLLCALAMHTHVMTCNARIGATHNPQHLHRTRHRNKFVKVRGTHFVLHGLPFLFNGFNSYWMMNVAVEPSERHKVTEVFRQATAEGLTVCRTWAFNDGGDRPLQSSPGVYDERVFQGLDFVIAEARKYGVRLILSLVNNYKDYGGKAQYVQWAQSVGASVKTEDDFYTNDLVRSYYKNHVKTILNRYNTFSKVSYKDDATIMAWELMNEPRCQTDYSGNTVNRWVKEMASYVKSIDKKHMLEIGMEGFYGDYIPDRKQFNPGYQVGTDFIANNRIKEIDFATIHAYPDQWITGQSDEAQLSFVITWMWSHWRDSKRLLKKPLVFAEFGKNNKASGYNLTSRNNFFATIYREIYRFARVGGSMSGGLIWQVMAEGMESYYDGYEIVLSKDPSMCGLVSRQSHALNGLAYMMMIRGNGMSEANKTENIDNEYGSLKP